MSGKPDIWVEVIDKSTGKSYYYNKKTKATTWSPPDNFVPANKPKQAALAVPESSASDWRETTDQKTGKKYYYNKRTKETVWRRPSIMGGAPVVATAATTDSKESKATTATSATSSAIGATASRTSTTTRSQKRQRTGTTCGSWEEVMDPSTGKKYWYNRDTHATAWVLPSSARQSAQEANVAQLERNLDRSQPARSPSPVNVPVVNPTPVLAPVEEKNTSPTGAAADSDLERPSDAMVRWKRAFNEQAQAELEEEEEDGDSTSFIQDLQFSKHRHGWFNRKFRTGDIADEKKLLSFKKSLIKKALLKKNRRLDAEAIQAFKNIMSFMGDRKTSKPPNLHVKKLLSNAMMHPASFRDEVYLQLIKQTTSNPKIQSTQKGWQLMTCCLACFPPSQKLKAFLKTYCEDTKNVTTDDQVRLRADDAVRRIASIVRLGQRKQVPSVKEIECLKNLSLVPLRIYLINDTFKTLQADSYTLVGDIQGEIEAKISLTLTSPFCLYESASTGANVEHILDRKDRILDVLAKWHEPNVEEKKEVVAHRRGGQAKTRTRLVNTPVYDRFLYKAKLVLKTSNVDVMADPEAVNLMYIQSIHEVISQRYPCQKADLERLAALQLQATFGDFNSQQHSQNWLVEKLPQFLPASQLGRNGVVDPVKCSEWEQKILEKYSKISGFTALEARLNYLDYIQEWPFYGATFFLVEQRQFKDYPPQILLGITCEGVILMHPQKQTLLENYPYTDIVTWGHSDERFIVVVGNIVQQRKLIFKTQHGKNMNNLIHDYVKFKVASTTTQS